MIEITNITMMMSFEENYNRINNHHNENEDNGNKNDNDKH